MEQRDWAVSALKDVLLENIRDRRRERRRKVIWKILKYMIYFFVIYFIYSSFKLSSKDDQFNLASSTRPHIAKIKVRGVISEDSLYANANNVIKSLNKAFESKHSVAILLDLNSPGGSAVQSNLIFEEIMALREKYPNKKVYSVISDLCASGCYYIAAASDAIIADKLSLVGSIGVIYSGFGFVDSIKKLGIERRVITAGKHKDLLDPFKPMDTWDEKMMKNILDYTHQEFISSVKLGRGSKLENNNANSQNGSQDNELFSGKVWVGEDAKKLGLIDEFGGKELVKNKANVSKVIDYTKEPDLFKMLSRGFGAESNFKGQVLAYLFDRKLDLRYDL